jgi:lycopene cyclase domain-containing protein
MTYLLLSSSFLMVSVAVLFVTLGWSARRRGLIRRWLLPALVSGAVLAALTALFDNLMITGGFMAYNRARISGVLIGAVPIEDFAYPLAALILLPALWLLLPGRRHGD